MNKQITLYIGGTKQRQAGFADLAIIGVFPVGEFKNMDRVTLIVEKPVWSIKHTSDYILYHLIDRRVKSFDADANGVLSIAMTIPNDMQLADGKSPYTLLKTIYDKFRNEYMTPYSDGRDSFLDKKVDSESFQQIVAQYSLEPHKGRYVVMNGSLTGTLCVPQDKMEDLFLDSQYAEFANFKDIEIGTSCNSTMGLELLEIPRPVSYEILVNGIKQPVSLSKPSDGYTTRLNDTDDYKYQNISFTLGDLMASENGIYTQGASSAKLDKVYRRIDCDVKRVEVKYKGILKFFGKTGNKDIVKRAIEHGDIRIEWGANYNLMDFQTSGMEFEIPATKLPKTNLRITPVKTKEGLQLSVSLPTIQVDSRIVEIEVTILMEEKKPVEIPAEKKDNSATRTNKLPQKQTFPKEEDTYEEEERKRKDPAEKNKLLVKGFVVGFVSALVLCCLGFGAYWMFKGDEPNGKTQQQLSNLQNEVDRLKNDCTNFTNEIERLKDELREAEDKLKKEDNVKKDAETNAEAANARAEAIADANKAKATAKAEILKLVQKKQLNECRSHSGWNKHLSNEERLGVEAILNPDQFKEEKDKKTNKKKYTPATVKKVKDYVNGLKIDSWDNIIEARKKILNILSNK